MEFIQIVYCCIIPFLLLIVQLPFSPEWRRTSSNLIAVLNFLLIWYSLFLLRQLVGIWQIAKQAADVMQFEDHGIDRVDGFLIRELLIIVLPVLFLFKKWMANGLLTLLMVVLLYWNHSIVTWNTYDLFFKIPVFFCLFCAGYALLWLQNKLPYQSPAT